MPDHHYIYHDELFWKRITLSQALEATRIWALLPTEFAQRRARSWWYMVEAIRADSSLLKQVAELLLL